MHAFKRRLLQKCSNTKTDIYSLMLNDWHFIRTFRGFHSYFLLIGFLNLVKFYIKIYLSYVTQQVQMHTQADTYQTPDLSPPLLTISGAKFHLFCEIVAIFYAIVSKRGRFCWRHLLKLLYRWPKVSTNSFWF